MLIRKNNNIPPPLNILSKEEIFNIKENVRFIITSKKKLSIYYTIYLRKVQCSLNSNDLR